MRILLSSVGFVLILPSLVILLLTGSAFFYSGKIFKSTMFRTYGLNLVYAADLLVNAVFLGTPNETVSARTAKALYSGQAKWWVSPLAQAIDWLALLISGERDHVQNALKGLPPTKDLWPWKD